MLLTCFAPILICFMCTLWHYYAFSGTNLLTRCRSASSCFLLFFGFRKVTQEIFSELDKTNCEVPIFTRRRRSPKESRRRATGRPHQAQARPDPGPRLGVVWAPLASTSLALPRIYSPSQENPRGREQNSTKSSDAAVIANPSSGGF